MKSPVRLSPDDDSRMLFPVLLYQTVKYSGVLGMKTDTSVRSGMPQVSEGVGAVNGVAAFEKDRPRHWGMVVFA